MQSSIMQVVPSCKTFHHARRSIMQDVPSCKTLFTLALDLNCYISWMCHFEVKYRTEIIVMAGIEKLRKWFALHFQFVVQASDENLLRSPPKKENLLSLTTISSRSYLCFYRHWGNFLYRISKLTVKDYFFDSLTNNPETSIFLNTCRQETNMSQAFIFVI